MSNPYLLFSSFFGLLPLAFFYLNPHKNNYENVLVCLLLINFGLSLLFWSKPIKNGTIHTIDAFFARVSFICFIAYIVFLKKISIIYKIISIFLFLIGIVMFYNGDKESSKNWCSKNHSMCHMFFHLFIFLAACFAFI